jgi:hypothetical protein
VEITEQARYSRGVYRTLIRRRVVSNFARLSAGDHRAVVAQLAPDVHHVAMARWPTRHLTGHFVAARAVRR